MVRLGIIGYGYWGPNLARNFIALPDCRLEMVVDARQERLDQVSRQYPAARLSLTPEVLWSDPNVDAVVIATPVFTHFELAKKALESGKHVLLEKPMTATVAEAEALIELANRQDRVLMVDHTFLYTGAVQALKAMIGCGDIGTLQYFDSTRINLGLFQPDVNVLWDLAPHDLSILDYLVDKSPYSVQATGISHTDNGIENIAYVTIHYRANFIAHLHCSWTSPVKIRMMLIGGDKKMVVYNDLEPTEKIKVYDTGFVYKTDEDKNRIMVDYRIGDIYLPKVAGGEALAGMAADFLSAILRGTNPVSDSGSGLRVIRLLEAAQVSLKNKGMEVVL